MNRLSRIKTISTDQKATEVIKFMGEALRNVSKCIDATNAQCTGEEDIKTANSQGTQSINGSRM